MKSNRDSIFVGPSSPIEFTRYCTKCGSKCDVTKSIDHVRFDEYTGEKHITYKYHIKCPNSNIWDFLFKGWYTHTDDLDITDQDRNIDK